MDDRVYASLSVGHHVFCRFMLEITEGDEILTESCMKELTVQHTGAFGVIEGSLRRRGYERTALG